MASHEMWRRRLRLRLMLCMYVCVLLFLEAADTNAAEAKGSSVTPETGAGPAVPLVPAIEDAHVPQLPEPNSEGVTSLSLGETIKLDHLGPMIVQSDGTARRITNWDKLTDREREVALRRIAQRNQVRIKALSEEAKPDSACPQPGTETDHCP